MRTKLVNSFHWVPILASVVTSGCRESTVPGDGDNVTIVHQPQNVLMPPAVCSNTGLGSVQDGLWKLFQCGSNISIALGTATSGTEGYLQTELQTVVSQWNSVLADQDAGLSTPLNLPRLTLNSAPATITVNFGPNEPVAGRQYCGTADPCFEVGANCSTNNTAVIKGDENVNNCVGNYVNYNPQSPGSLFPWLTHEMGHALGFQSDVYHTLDLTHNGHCFVRLSGSVARTQFGTGCQYEIEKLFYRYGIRSTNPDEFKHIITGLELAGPAAVVPHGAATMSVSNVVFEKANAASLCPNFENPHNLDLRFVGCVAKLSPTGFAFGFTSSDPQIVSVSGGTTSSRTLTGGTKFGTATITVTVNPGIHQLATLFGRLYTNVRTIAVSGTLAINGGNNQSADAGSLVPIAPSVLVTDMNGQPVSGVAVTFGVQSGGGSVTGASPLTNGSGIAQVGSWRLGTTVGVNTLSASVQGLTTKTFTATGVTPFVVTATAPQNVTNKATYPLTGSASQPATAWRWDRSDDNGVTWSLWANSQNSSFISYFGCYTIYWRLTATRVSDGVVRSGTTTTTVANTSGCGPPP